MNYSIWGKNLDWTGKYNIANIIKSQLESIIQKMNREKKDGIHDYILQNMI